MFNCVIPAVMTVSAFLICVMAALVLGLLTALVFSFRSEHSGNLPFALVLVPPIVTLVIMMVNGNIGAGVAVAGVFGLVRFRSVPGTAKEIGIIFLAMGAGLIAGMGYLGYATLFTVVMCAVMLLYNTLDFGTKKNAALYKTLRVTIPEDLDYTNVFEDVFPQYVREWELSQVKTTNMGSLFRLTYDITLRDASVEKALIDELRKRNGNLEITVSKQETTSTEL